MSDPSDLQRVLAGSSLPEGSRREERVAWLAEVSQGLLRNPNATPAELFVAGGLWSWLHEGGHLTRDYWRVSARAGSHHTEAHVWRSMSSSRGATDEDETGSMPGII